MDKVRGSRLEVRVRGNKLEPITSSLSPIPTKRRIA
jgi:hypothetical protein